ncbi:MAG: ABC transporter permease, partial [bacterium]|nr:ABC transporter permease [Candidatus Kapabacteria bacterium]
VMSVTFVVVRILPGDPARLMAGQRADLQSIESLRRQWKLNEPLPVQYFDFLMRASTGDLGRSFAFNRPVVETIIDKVPATAILAVSALTLSSLLGIAIGVISAWKPNTWFDNVAMLTALLGISVPSFVLAVMLALIFAYWLHLFPGTGYITRGTRVDFMYLILPMIALAARPLSIIARITRSSMLDVLSQDYVRTARAKGLPVHTTVLKHALRNALNPVVTTISAWLAATLAGTLFIEYVFNWPGLGSLALSAVQQLDYPIIQGVVLFTAIVFVIINFLVDVVYSVLDPKVRLS